MGVSYLTVFSRQSPGVWCLPLNSTEPPSASSWQMFSLPSEAVLAGSGGVGMEGNGGGVDQQRRGGGVAMVANGLAHSLYLTDSGKGMWSLA